MYRLLRPSNFSIAEDSVCRELEDETSHYAFGSQSKEALIDGINLAPSTKNVRVSSKRNWYGRFIFCYSSVTCHGRWHSSCVVMNIHGAVSLEQSWSTVCAPRPIYSSQRWSLTSHSTSKRSSVLQDSPYEWHDRRSECIRRRTTARARWSLERHFAVWAELVKVRTANFRHW